MTKLEKLYRDALERIARCDEGNLERYCAKVDDIAVVTLAEADAMIDEEGHTDAP